MGIEQRPIAQHWNYFLCLEDDIVELARWIELSEQNYNTYSLELARLLMTASAEVDVVAKLIATECFQSKAKGIYAYQELFLGKFPTISKAQIDIPRYGLTLKPWSNWNKPRNPPAWWTANNDVKHHRTDHYNQATLKNTLNAVAALFHLLILYYGSTGQTVPASTKLLKSGMLIETIDGSMAILTNQVIHP